MKHSSTKFGELAPQEAVSIPWHDIHIDLIGPWNIQIKNNMHKFIALTSMDPVLNLVEITQMNDKKSQSALDAFINGWLSCYPRPICCVHNNGREFLGHNFQFGLIYAGIRSKPISP